MNSLRQLIISGKIVNNFVFVKGFRKPDVPGQMTKTLKQDRWKSQGPKQTTPQHGAGQRQSRRLRCPSTGWFDQAQHRSGQADWGWRSPQ